jgi:hypothetical protein
MQRKLWLSIKFYLITKHENLEQVLAKDIDSRHLEERYGGQKTNLEAYWPPFTPTDHKRSIND